MRTSLFIVVIIWLDVCTNINNRSTTKTQLPESATRFHPRRRPTKNKYLTYTGMIKVSNKHIVYLLIYIFIIANTFLYTRLAIKQVQISYRKSKTFVLQNLVTLFCNVLSILIVVTQHRYSNFIKFLVFMSKILKQVLFTITIKRCKNYIMNVETDQPSPNNFY